MDTCSALPDITSDLHNNVTDAEAVQPATTQSGSCNAALDTTRDLTNKVVAENTSAMDIAAEELHLKGRTGNINEETSREMSGTARKEVKVYNIVSLNILSQFFTLISNFCRRLITLQQKVHLLILRCPTNVSQRYQLPLFIQKQSNPHNNWICI